MISTPYMTPTRPFDFAQGDKVRRLKSSSLTVFLRIKPVTLNNSSRQSLNGEGNELDRGMVPKAGRISEASGRSCLLHQGKRLAVELGEVVG